MAVWFAPPPIQLPARVDNPLHTASGPTPPTVSGENIETNKMNLLYNIQVAFYPYLKMA